MDTSKALDQFWQDKAHVIRQFIDIRPNYEKLAEEVSYILKKCVESENVEYSEITHRTKTLDSFCEKSSRKGYKDSIKEITDIAGVRIVFLYISDLPKIEDIIEKNFEVVDKIEKLDKEDIERFGYGAMHFLVSLDEKASGARYDELKELVCEIQVRTILQDAWAIVSHHLSYKQESDIPKQLRRKLNALSGLFETADDQFNRLRDERKSYSEEVKKKIAEKSPDFLREEINLDNLIEYLNWRLPDRGKNSRDEISSLLSELIENGYTRLSLLDHVISIAYEAVKAYESKYLSFGKHYPVGVVRVALYMTNKKYMEKKFISEKRRMKLLEFQSLIKQ